MTHTINRRQALSGLGVGTLGVTVAAAAPQAADAAAPSVRGTWTIAPKTARGPAPFQAMAAFAAGGVFITTGSDEAGTGVGEWSQSGANGFAFTYVNFHFNPAGKPANTVKVRAAGTFGGSQLSGKATLGLFDPAGKRLAADAHFEFTGRRLAIQAP